MLFLPFSCSGFFFQYDRKGEEKKGEEPLPFFLFHGKKRNPFPAADSKRGAGRSIRRVTNQNENLLLYDTVSYLLIQIFISTIGRLNFAFFWTI